MIRACHRVGISRQGYYKCLGKEKEQIDLDQAINCRVKRERNRCGMIGGRKLFYLMRPHIPMGRDKFFQWLRKNELLIIRKRRYTRTTDSRHGLQVPSNRIKYITPSEVNQIWVSDITYLRTVNGFCYLALIMDLFSRKILGYDVNNTLELIGAERALQMAQKQLEKPTPVIHHSDRGRQYASPRYIELLKKKGMTNSMSAAGNCYDNAAAERLNGILKMEYSLDITFDTVEHAKAAVKQAVLSYNNHRPHWSLNLKTPSEIYFKTNQINN